jgi:hypothetical protein
MKLLVLGASGTTGGWLTRLSAQAGHVVTALVRPGATFVASANLRVIRGEALDPAALAATVEGQDAVASCLGIRQGRLDWLAVRPVTLMNGRPTGLAGRVDRYGLFSIVRRSDVAAWMLGALSRPTPYVEQTVLLGTTVGNRE